MLNQSYYSQLVVVELRTQCQTCEGGKSTSDLTAQCHREWSSTITIKHGPISGVHKVEGKMNPPLCFPSSILSLNYAIALH